MVGVFAATDVFLFYVLFEAMLDPGLLPHRVVRRRAAAVRRGEVPAVLPGRRPGHAGRRHRAVLRRAPAARTASCSPTSSACTSTRPPSGCCSSASSSRSRSRRRCGRCTPGCPTPRPRRRRPRRRAAGRRARQGRHLRHDPASACRCSRTPPSGRRPVVIVLARHLDPLRRAARHRPDRHHAADRLHLDQPLRLHRAGHLRDDLAGPVRLDALHGQPRLLDRRAVPDRGDADPAPRLAADPRLRRLAAGHPGCSPASSWSPACPPGAARPVDVRQRVPGPGRAPSSATRSPRSSPPSASSWPRSTSC